MNHLLHFGLILVLPFIGLMGMLIIAELIANYLWHSLKEMSDILDEMSKDW